MALLTTVLALIVWPWIPPSLKIKLVMKMDDSQAYNGKRYCYNNLFGYKIKMWMIAGIPEMSERICHNFVGGQGVEWQDLDFCDLTII